MSSTIEYEIHIEEFNDGTAEFGVLVDNCFVMESVGWASSYEEAKAKVDAFVAGLKAEQHESCNWCGQGEPEFWTQIRCADCGCRMFRHSDEAPLDTAIYCENANCDAFRAVLFMDEVTR